MSTNPGYERSDARLKPLILFAIALTVLITLTLWIVSAIESGFARSLARDDRSHPLQDLREAPTAPELQSHPTAELEEHESWERGILGEYDWIDRENGVIRIPLERAMQLTVERGLPHREKSSQEDGR